MGLGLGYKSYVSYIGQTAFGTAGVPTTTAANLRTGAVFSPRASQQARMTTTSTMQRASQLWSTVKLTDFTFRFEWVQNPLWRQLLTSAWGKRITTATDVPPRIYSLNDAPVDPSTADTTTIFYNRGLTIRHTIHDGSANVRTYEAKDCNITRFQMFFERDKPVEFEVSGVGQALVDAAAAPTYTDMTGTLVTWTHAGFGANSGLYIHTANPPALGTAAGQVILARATFTLDHNLRFDPFLGTAAGSELKLPTRTTFPAASLELEADFEGGLTGMDAVEIVTDFVNSTAKNLRIRYYVGATEYFDLQATGATAPAIVDEPKPLQSSEGVVGFSARYKIFPDTGPNSTASGDLSLSVNNAT